MNYIHFSNVPIEIQKKKSFLSRNKNELSWQTFTSNFKNLHAIKRIDIGEIEMDFQQDIPGNVRQSKSPNQCDTHEIQGKSRESVGIS